MKVILSMAMSANGMVASDSGSEDFLSDLNWQRFIALVKKVGALVWGRKTYETVLGWGPEALKDLEGIEKIVVTKSQIELVDGFTAVSSPEGAITKLEVLGFEELVISGGSTLNSTFAIKGLINEVILDVNPILVGRGVGVFSPELFELKMELISVEKIGESIVELKYRVAK